MATTRIPATVITGFLGSGKTTLIRNIITQANGKRLALIVNEFGDIGMDGDMLKDCGKTTAVVLRISLNSPTDVFAAR